MKGGIIAGLSLVVRVAIGTGAASQRVLKKIKWQKEYADKYLALYLLMNQWIKVKQENKSMPDYLKKKDAVKLLFMV